MSWIFSREVTFRQKVLGLLFSQGVQALAIFRISQWCFKSYIFRVLKFHLLFYRVNQMLCSVDIDPETQIGRNLCLPHPVGIVIGGTARIGEGVTIMQHVTIGSRTLGQMGKRHADISDGVFIGPNACLLGAICIGQGAIIGANTVVTRDVAANSKVVQHVTHFENE